MDNANGWAAEQLTAFLAGVTQLDDAASILQSGLERISEAVEAEVVTLVSDEGVLASWGFPRDHEPYDEMLNTTSGSTDAHIDGLGRCVTLTVPFEGSPSGRLFIARAGDESFTSVERNLLRGMSKVLTLSLRAHETLATERRLRAESERQALENADLLDRLRERQTLLERLAHIQRSIATRVPLTQVLDAIVAGAAEILGEPVIGLRLVDPVDSGCLNVIGSIGIDPDMAHLVSRCRVGEGAGGRAFAEKRLVVIDDYANHPDSLTEFAAWGLQTAMAAPVYEDGTIAGSLVIASSTPGRVFTPAEQEALLSFADHASLALTDAHTVQALRDALATARHDAMHDPLTGLPNRALLRDRLVGALNRARRSGMRVALLFLDLDGFKRVNDSLGHDAGDELLTAVADRLKTCARDVDTLARLGGDEFAFLIEEVTDESAATNVSERVLAALGEPFAIGLRDIDLQASIGIALSGTSGEGVRELLRNADLAMYQAKAAGKGRHVYFHEGMYDEILARLELEGALRRGLDDKEFILEYQPIVDLDNGRPTHFEALVRWIHPERGRIPPVEFVPLAEATGLIVPLGEWILNEACRQAVLWQAQAPVTVSVNLSPAQISAELPAQVEAILTAHGLPPHRLTLEITESLLTGDNPTALDALTRIRELGVHLSIDDFGTGYSSLSRLRTLPVDQLKIDRSFVDALSDQSGSAALVGGVVAIARGLGLDVVAEGVETPEQLRVLRRLGCREAQGFLLGRPASADDTTRLLADSARTNSAAYTAIPRTRPEPTEAILHEVRSKGLQPPHRDRDIN